jgi:hypothetical protein
MTAMEKRKTKTAPVVGVLADILAIPGNLFSGFVTGVVAPIAAIAGMVALMRLLTGKVPYLGHIYEEEEGDRHLSFKLVAPEQVKDLFQEQKEQYGGDIVKLQAEIKSIIEETRAEAQADAEKVASKE